MVDGERQQCLVDSDCTALGAGAVCTDSVCAPDPAWACLGRVIWPPPEPRKALVTLRLRDLVTEAPVAGVEAKLCHKLDYFCERPLATGLVSNAFGDLVTEVDTGFDGYVELSAPDKLPGLFFFFPPIDGDREVANLPVIGARDLVLFGNLSGRPALSGRGHVMLGAYDCIWRPAPGVQLTTEAADVAIRSFYLIEKVPSVTAMATDASGRGGIMNLFPGPAALTGSLLDGRRLATVGVFVRSDTVTFTTMVPAP